MHNWSATKRTQCDYYSPGDRGTLALEDRMLARLSTFDKALTVSGSHQAVRTSSFPFLDYFDYYQLPCS
jgi:hypothetical protein